MRCVTASCRKRIRQETARLHPRHVGRVVEGRFRQLHHVGALAGKRDESVQHRVPGRCVAKTRVGSDESGDQRLPPMVIEQLALGLVDVSITFVVERSNEFIDVGNAAATGRFVLRVGMAARGSHAFGRATRPFGAGGR